MYGFLCLCVCVCVLVFGQGWTEREGVCKYQVKFVTKLQYVLFKPHMRKSNFSSYGFRQFKPNERKQTKVILRRNREMRAEQSYCGEINF